MHMAFGLATAHGAGRLARASSHVVSGIRCGLDEWQGFTKSTDGSIHTRISYTICQTKPKQFADKALFGWLICCKRKILLNDWLDDKFSEQGQSFSTHRMNK
jgi:hypothetical protein